MLFQDFFFTSFFNSSLFNANEYFCLLLSQKNHFSKNFEGSNDGAKVITEISILGFGALQISMSVSPSVLTIFEKIQPYIFF
jgi:hypothetical protein